MEVHSHSSFILRSRNLQNMDERWWQVTRPWIAEEMGSLHQTIHYQNLNFDEIPKPCCCFGIPQTCIFHNNWFKIKKDHFVKKRSIFGALWKRMNYTMGNDRFWWESWFQRRSKCECCKLLIAQCWIFCQHYFWPVLQSLLHQQYLCRAGRCFLEPSLAHSENDSYKNFENLLVQFVQFSLSRDRTLLKALLQVPHFLANAKQEL